MAKSFDALANRVMTPAARATAATRAQQLLAEMLLADVRAMTGKSQRQLANALGIKQPSVAKMEAAGDMQVSTLRRLVAALGGELELRAKLPGGDVAIKLPKPTTRKARRPRPPA